MGYGPELDEFMARVHGQAPKADPVIVGDGGGALPRLLVEGTTVVLFEDANDNRGTPVDLGDCEVLVDGMAVKPFEAAPTETEPEPPTGPDLKRQEFLRETLGRIRANLTKFDWRVFVAIVNGVGGMHDLFAVLAYDRSKAGLGGKLLGSLNRLHRKGLIVREDRKAPWQATNPALRGLRVQA